jgi:hypothetical protein
MIPENPPSRLHEGNENQASDTTTTARGRYCPAASGSLPKPRDCTPLTTLGGVELETDVVSDRFAAERATMATGSPAAKVLVQLVSRHIGFGPGTPHP